MPRKASSVMDERLRFVGDGKGGVPIGFALGGLLAFRTHVHEVAHRKPVAEQNLP
jgi:hypothetical protein